MISGMRIKMTELNDLINVLNDYLTELDLAVSIDLLDCRESAFSETGFVQHKRLYGTNLSDESHEIITELIPKVVSIPKTNNQSLFNNLRDDLLDEVLRLKEYVVSNDLSGVYKLVITRYEVVNDYSEIEYEMIFVNDDEA